MTQGDRRQADDFDWGSLAARTLNPVQVEVIEALRWIALPLSPLDLLHVFEGKRSGLRIEHHLRRLVRLDAVAPSKTGQAYSSVERPYRLVGRLSP